MPKQWGSPPKSFLATWETIAPTAYLPKLPPFESWDLYPGDALYAALLEEREQVELELRKAVELYPEDSVYAALLEHVLTQPALVPPPQCTSPQSAHTAQPVLSAPGHCQAPRLLIAPKDNKDSYDALEEIRSDNVGLLQPAQPVHTSTLHIKCITSPLQPWTRRHRQVCPAAPGSSSLPCGSCELSLPCGSWEPWELKSVLLLLGSLHPREPNRPP
jgi:hypothetical protein